MRPLPTSDLGGTEAKITLTLDCTNDCRFCYNRVSRAAGTATIPRERALELIEQAACTSATTLNLIGGEVTMLPYFLEVVAAGRRHFPSVSINTNGRRFAEPGFAAAAVAAGLTHVDVSLHGSRAAVHEALTQAPGSFAECVQGLRELVAQAPRLRSGRAEPAGAAALAEGTEPRVRVAVTTLVVPDNLHDLAALADLLADLGVASWRVKYAHGVLGCAPGEHDAPIVPYAEALPVLRDVLTRHADRLNARVHDVPLCVLGDLMLRSTDSDDRVVAVYKQEGLQETVRVAGHWGDTTPRCAPCAAAGWCCKPSPAYLVQHGDADVTPFDEAGLAAALAAAQAAEARRVAGSVPPTSAQPEARPQADLLARLHAAAASHAWADVRRLAAQVSADHPERAAVDVLRRRAERELLNARAEGLRAAGRVDEARRLGRMIARRYADLDAAPASPTPAPSGGTPRGARRS